MNATTTLDPWYAEVLHVEPITQLRQVVKHDPPNSYGDCFRTVIACLIGASDPTVVPHFVADNIERHPDEPNPAYLDLRAARSWLRRRGLDLFPMSCDDADDLGVPYKAAVAVSPMGVPHSVVARSGRIEWCPAGRPLDTMEVDRTQSAWVIARPWRPTPTAMVREWRTTVPASPEGTQR